MPIPHYIELIGKTIAIIETLRDRHDGLTLRQLAVHTGQVKSSVHRILRSLMHHGYIEQDRAGGVYRLGIQFLVVAQSLRVSTNFVELARPYSRDLMETFDETTYIAVLRDGRGVFVDVQETRRDLRLVGPLGAEVHFHATAAGKAMAAFFPPAHAEAVLRKLGQRSLERNEQLNLSDVRHNWEQVRELGYAVNDEQTIVGAIFLAAPIFDSTGSVCGSISIGIPKPRYSAQAGEEISTELKDSCRRLSDVLKAIGYVHESSFGGLGVAT
jgi:IclR family acetate operon transcriptional repressor